MKKIFALSALSIAVLYGGFWPDFSFAYEHGKGNVDKNFVRDDKQQIVLDKKEKKFYYDAKPSGKMDWHDAVQYCEKMDYLGYTKWQLPTKEEMRSLLELSRRDVTVKHAFKHVQKGIYWSSTKDRKNEAWYFDFELGRYFVTDMDKKFYALCVGREK